MGFIFIFIFIWFRCIQDFLSGSPYAEERVAKRRQARKHATAVSAVNTRQRNTLVTLAPPEEMHEDRRQFIKKSALRIVFPKQEPESEEEVGAYHES